MIKIAPSILSADFAKLGEEITVIDQAGADLIHIDVMDGHFVPNLTIGSCVIKAIRPYTQLPFDVHLMIQPVNSYLDHFAQAGADIITIHPEAEKNYRHSLQTIRAMGKKAGLALNPDTSIDVLDPVMDCVDLILVMTVYPGFGGQKHISLNDKIGAVRKKIDASNLIIDLEVDGGVDSQTAPAIIKAGANILVAGTSIFQGKGNYTDNIQTLRSPNN